MKLYALTLVALCLCAVATAEEAPKKSAADKPAAAQSAASTKAAKKNTATMTLIITGMKSDKGKIRVIVARNQRQLDFRPSSVPAGAKIDPKDEAFKKLGLTIKDGKAKIVLKDIPRGEYAIKLFHDENANEKMDVSAIGIPKEPYGFSNNARGRFGPPSYDKVKFQLTKAKQNVQIKVK